MRLIKPSVRPPVAALLVAASWIAFPANRATEARAASSAAISAIRIDNFGQVGDNYYRGAQPAGRDYADLATLGVRAVINLTSDDAEPDEKNRVESTGMVYFQIPMTTRDAPTAAQVAEFLGIVNNPANQPIYVHCVGGRHRTGVMTAVYRMEQDRWTADKAFQEMKRYKFGLDFLHPEFKRFVYGYQPQLALRAESSAPVVAATAAQR